MDKQFKIEYGEDEEFESLYYDDAVLYYLDAVVMSNGIWYGTSVEEKWRIKWP